MLNYIKADLYRIMTRPTFYIWPLLLAALPAAMIAGAGGMYPAGVILAAIPALVYAAFCLMALILTEHTFREDMQLGLYKNDMAGGASRSAVYIAKLITGILLLALLWAVCSLSCIVSASYWLGGDSGLSLLKDMASLQAASLFLRVNVFLAVFQAISIVFKKTSALILVYIAISAAMAYAMKWLGAAWPGLAGFIKHIAGFGAYGNFGAAAGAPHAAGGVALLLAPAACIIVLAAIGSMMFEKKEF
ncbi:MAG: hypothetical protein LBH86_02640 [Oscillospiraceae bacterium]|jgi:hypothetical protein|nr:hypothetical protein [Oscillospiraceae bacterium]